MPEPKPPSYINPTAFPIFTLSWIGSSSPSSSSPNSPPTPGAIAYAGGGGAARTGVGNSIVLNGHKIDTKDQICVNVHLHPRAGLLACVGDQLRLYEIASGTLLAHVTCDGRGGLNCATFSLCGEIIAAGCENGSVLFFRLAPAGSSGGGRDKVAITMVAEGKGHEKAVCSIAIRQDRVECVSAAKDGTARVWDTADGTELGVLKCSVKEDGPAKKAAPPKRSNRPVQILVRGCAYGDDGSIYTVASAKRGKAFLTRWVLQPPQYVETRRIVCSDVPVSAAAMSEDRMTLALGGVDGSVRLFDVESLRLLKTFWEIHDLPVTCIAARPNVTQPEHDLIDAISSSADNKMAYLSMSREKLSWFAFLILMIIPVILGILAKFLFEECAEELTTMGFDKCTECMLNSMVAPKSRPGIMVPPY